MFLISNLCIGTSVVSNPTVWHNNVSDKSDYILDSRIERDRLYFLHSWSVIPSSRRTLTCYVWPFKNLLIYLWFLICKNVKKSTPLPWRHLTSAGNFCSKYCRYLFCIFFYSRSKGIPSVIACMIKIWAFLLRLFKKNPLQNKTIIRWLKHACLHLKALKFRL